MLKSLLLIFIFIFINSQTVEFYRSSSQYKFNDLEEEIFRNVIKLYNAKNENKLKLNVSSLEFKDILNLLDKNKNPFLALMNGVTITEERKKVYTFSDPYLPIQQAIFKHKKSKNNNWKTSEIGYLAKSMEDQTILKLKKEFRITGIPFDSFEKKLASISQRKTDFIIADNIAVLIDSTITPLEFLNINPPSGFGILYTKNSPLKKMLDPYLKYYISSSKFYLLLKKYYGEKITNYFVKHVKNQK